MTGTGRLGRLALLVSAVAVLLAAGAGVGKAGDAQGLWGRSSPAVTAGGANGTSAAGATETRLQRDIEGGKGQRLFRHDGLTGPTAFHQRPSASLDALAALFERAGHPERIGHILLRGPPGSSA